MKGLKFFEKVMFFCNSIAAFVLLLAFILPLMPPKTFPILSVLSLALPLLILINTIFFLYWLLKVKKQFLLSLLVLAVGYFAFGSIYKFSENNEEATSKLSVMNYNVRLFNLYDWISETDVETKIETFLKSESPDVLCIQEYHPHENVNLSFYPHKYEKLSGTKNKYGQAIFSKYKIINSGSIEFPNTSNNAIFVDVKVKNDTLRVYNVHLQSLRLDPKNTNINQEESERIVKGICKTFEVQQEQAKLFIAHKNKSPYKSIISGDFNNTAFSYVYKEIKGDFKDAFKISGNGFGRSYDFKFFPIRIDFILVDPVFKVQSFKTYDVELSDHYPIKAVLDY